VCVAARARMRLVSSTGSDSAAQQARPPRLTERNEMRDVHRLIGMEQQILKVHEALYTPDGDPSTLVADAPEIIVVGKDRALRWSARRALGTPMKREHRTLFEPVQARGPERRSRRSDEGLFVLCGFFVGSR